MDCAAIRPAKATRIHSVVRRETALAGGALHWQQDDMEATSVGCGPRFATESAEAVPDGLRRDFPLSCQPSPH